ncbi:MAG: hypothetical protein ACR2FN_14940 [Chitinophagaceae bacterium]
MKKIASSLIFIFVSVSAFSQIVSASMGEEFKQLAATSTTWGNRETGFGAIQTYSSGEVKGSQFFYPNWAPGSVTTVHNEVISNNYLFIYDKVRQQLFIKEKTNDPALASYQATKGTANFAKPKNTDIVVVADKNQISSFTINTDKPHVFIQAAIYDPSLNGNFFEVLVQSPNYSLFKLVQTTFEKADMGDMLKVKNGDFADEFVDHVTYYIYHNNKLQKINFKEYSLRKALKDQAQKVDDYLDMHQNQEMNEELLIDLINQINS